MVPQRDGMKVEEVRPITIAITVVSWKETIAMAKLDMKVVLLWS